MHVHFAFRKLLMLHAELPTISGVTLTLSGYRLSSSAGNYHYDITAQFANHFCRVTDYDDPD